MSTHSGVMDIVTKPFEKEFLQQDISASAAMFCGQVKDRNNKNK